MEFACTHVVCNWKADAADQPPPLPPRRLRKPRPSSLPPPLPSSHPVLGSLPLPPPLPPRQNKLDADNRLTANVNVVSLGVGQLVGVSWDMETFQSPVVCGKCSAALSSLSSVHKNVWLCEFCGCESGVDGEAARLSPSAGGRCDHVYLPTQSADEYENLEDALVVFCVDISGSMSVTTEVTPAGGGGSSAAYISRLESVQDGLQRALTSLLQQSPHRRVALVTFNDEVVVYGDGTRTPLTLKDWALVDYDHIWQQSVAYSIPHCIAETFHQLTQRVNELREHGATALGPAALASVALASRYPGSKVILCTDGKANIGLGEMEDAPAESSSPVAPYFYRQLAVQAVDRGVIMSVMTFEGTDCRLADVGRLADTTGGKVNIVSPGTVATELQSVLVDNVLATGAMVTLLAPAGVYFPFEEGSDHRLVRHVGNVTRGQEVTVQFAVRPAYMKAFLQKDALPFQLQLSFKTRDQRAVTRILTERRPVATSSQILAASLNTAVLGVHCAQLCAGLTMNGRVQEAQRQLKAQQRLLEQVSKLRPMEKEESIYSNWMDTMTTICDDITTETQTLSDEAAKVVYQMRRVSSVSYSNSSTNSNQRKVPKKLVQKRKEALEAR